jgi:hypothetical protein
MLSKNNAQYQKPSGKAIKSFWGKALNVRHRLGARKDLWHAEVGIRKHWGKETGLGLCSGQKWQML